VNCEFKTVDIGARKISRETQHGTNVGGTPESLYFPVHDIPAYHIIPLCPGPTRDSTDTRFHILPAAYEHCIIIYQTQAKLALTYIICFLFS
jgi:hypothetical protein